MNVWKVFESLLPKQQVLVGEVVSINSSNQTARIELLSGEEISVKGTGTIGTKYLIKDGVIGSEMPDLTSYDVEIL